MRPIRVPRTTTARLPVPRRSSFAALLGTRCTGARRQQILRPVCCVCSGHLSGVKNRIACATWLCTYAPPSITPPEPSTIPPAFLFPNPTPTWGDIFGGGPRCLSRRASPPPPSSVSSRPRHVRRRPPHRKCGAHGAAGGRGLSPNPGFRRRPPSPPLNPPPFPHPTRLPNHLIANSPSRGLHPCVPRLSMQAPTNPHPHLSRSLQIPVPTHHPTHCLPAEPLPRP